VRILGIDPGERRTGVAVSDLTGTLAGGIELVEASGLNDCAKKVMAIAEKYRVSEIVIGYPVNMNGTLGESAKRAEKFRDLLEDCINEKGWDTAVALFDERMTSSLAHVYMNQTGIKGKNRKEKIDMLSAQIILQNYMDRKKNM
jgi:putative Holliday junction resolvase